MYVLCVIERNKKRVTYLKLYPVKQIDSTNFSLGVVVGAGDTHPSLDSIPAEPSGFNYHRMDLLGTSGGCKHFNRYSKKGFNFRNLLLIMCFSTKHTKKVFRWFSF